MTSYLTHQSQMASNAGYGIKSGGSSSALGTAAPTNNMSMDLARSGLSSSNVALDHKGMNFTQTFADNYQQKALQSAIKKLNEKESLSQSYTQRSSFGTAGPGAGLQNARSSLIAPSDDDRGMKIADESRLD